MDAFLAIASKREVRDYAATPVPANVRARILDAGRLSGSSQNKQQWEFVVVSGAARERLADAVYAPENVRTATLVVAIVGEAGGFDVGRCAQNMMLAAWNEGIGSCPAHLPETEVAALLGIPEAVSINRVIAFGYIDPTRPTAPPSVSRTRLPIDKIAHWETWQGTSED